MQTKLLIVVVRIRTSVIIARIISSVIIATASYGTGWVNRNRRCRAVGDNVCPGEGCPLSKEGAAGLAENGFKLVEPCRRLASLDTEVLS